MPARAGGGGDHQCRRMLARQIGRHITPLLVFDGQALAHQRLEHLIRLTGQRLHGHCPLNASAAVVEAQQAADAAVFAVHRLCLDVQRSADPVIHRNRLVIRAAMPRAVVPGAGAIVLTFAVSVLVVHGETGPLDFLGCGCGGLAHQTQMRLVVLVLHGQCSLYLRVCQRCRSLKSESSSGASAGHLG
ncbi:hypothetical protein D3C84_793750 [compost metagenome]